jgi:hypothetical protein
MFDTGINSPPMIAKIFLRSVVPRKKNSAETLHLLSHISCLTLTRNLSAQR